MTTRPTRTIRTVDETVAARLRDAAAVPLTQNQIDLIRPLLDVGRV
jgi:hypothetical protein